MGSTGKTDSPEGTARLENFGKRVLKQTGPSRKLMLGQLEHAISGGDGSRIPIIGRAINASQQATRQALAGTTESLGLSGLQNSVFGNRIMGRVRDAGARQQAGIPARIMAPMIANAPSIIHGFQKQGMGALATGTRLRLQQEMFNDTQSRKFFQDLKDSLSSYGGGGGGGMGASGGGGG